MANKLNTTSPSPFSLPNIRRFLAFRILFNARFYYPVFTILFLDFGLSLEQFAILNTIWAFTIVLAEVPSGALADLMGRKQLLLATSFCMIAEMTVIALAPAKSGSIFWFFLVNRIISGLAEAMASGADEALAYDTLVENKMEDSWPLVLDWQMRVQNLGFIFAMTVGAIIYDHSALNRIFAFFGTAIRVAQETSMRFPIYLTLLFAILALWTTMGMHEPKTSEQKDGSSETAPNIFALLKLTLRAGSWIVHTPFALAIIMYAMVLDHTLRMVVTLTSQYYRLIQLPESIFGLIGSAIALLGLVVPRLARFMTERYTAGTNTIIVSLFMLFTLVLLGQFIPYIGVIPMVMVFVGMMMTGFFTSHYLNAITSSEQRATVLSFKGLAFNAAYGLIGIGFAALMHHERLVQAMHFPGAKDGQVENAAFQQAMTWFPWYLVICLLAVSAFCIPLLRRKIS